MQARVDTFSFSPRFKVGVGATCGSRAGAGHASTKRPLCSRRRYPARPRLLAL